MSKFIEKLLFKSKGVKRGIAGALSALSSLIALIPGADTVNQIVQLLAGLFGATGLGHAVIGSTLDKNKLSSFASVAATLLTLSYGIPWLLPYSNELQIIAATLGAAGFGANLKK